MSNTETNNSDGFVQPLKQIPFLEMSQSIRDNQEVDLVNLVNLSTPVSADSSFNTVTDDNNNNNAENDNLIDSENQNPDNEADNNNRTDSENQNQDINPQSNQQVNQTTGISVSNDDNDDNNDINS